MRSAVAGVVDRNGSVRVVIGPRDRMWCHVAPGERIFILPRLRVTEPVDLPHIPGLLARVTAHVRKKLKESGVRHHA